MHQGIEYSDFEKALNTLGVVSKTDRKTLRSLYLSLCKEYHPDKHKGDTNAFQEINDAYELLTHYMDNFRFDFDEEEFKKQHHYYSLKDWLSGR